MNNFGERLKQLRKKNNLTQKELAQKVFVSPSYVSKLEKNSEEPSPKLITLIALEFNVSTDYLLYGTEDNNFKNDLWWKRKKDKQTTDELIEDLDKFISYIKSSNSAVFQSEIGGILIELVYVLQMYEQNASENFSINFLHILSDYLFKFFADLQELEETQTVEEVYSKSFSMLKYFQELVEDVKDLYIQRIQLEEEVKTEPK